VLDPVHLSAEEMALLTQHYRKSHQRLVRERAQTILSANKGFSAHEISQILLRSEKTIRGWIRAYQKRGISSLFPAYRGDNAGKLSKEQKATLKAILAKPPSEYGIPQRFWDISSLKQYIKGEFGVEYESNESYRLIFVLHNYSFHLPDTFDRKRDDAKVEKRIKEIKKEIAPMLNDDTWLVFTSDECRIIWESEIRRLWLPKGQKTIIKVERKRRAQSFIGFLNLKTGKDLLYRLAWQKQDEIIPVLEGLVRKYPNKRICIIWDNARFHHGKKLKAKLSTTLAPIHLINLPPYAPDHNPQEHVWKYGKDKLANNQRDSLEETIQAFESSIMSRNYPYHF
jgi:transposase